MIRFIDRKNNQVVRAKNKSAIPIDTHCNAKIHIYEKKKTLSILVITIKKTEIIPLDG